MAHKRMFSKDITESDAFADMPLSTQALYFHLGMSADDDGFINNPKRIQRSIGASTDDLSLLMAKKFIIPFESGVVVIKHWKINNTVRSDRYCPTNYKDEYAQLEIEDNKAYRLKNGSPELLVSNLDTIGIPNASNLDTQNRIGEDRIGERSTLSGKPDASEKVDEIVGYLNAKTGKSFRTTTRETVRLVNARLKEGYTVEDIKAVIDKKVAQWANDPKFSAYLPPSTLFAPSHFENYLNEVTVVRGRRSGKYGKYD